LLNALERPDLVSLCLRGPGPHQQPVIQVLKATFGKMSSDEALAFLSGLDICFGPVNSLPDAFEDEDVKAREMILRDDLGRRHLAPSFVSVTNRPRPD
jgi:crotonobetainyl-CoA:carnitine CoA-transferase CaiB-like acyl-CoA transferase